MDLPCFMVREGVDSSKNPTTFAGVPATMLQTTKFYAWATEQPKEYGKSSNIWSA